MKYIQKVKIKNDLGLHTRPATVIVKLLQAYKSQVSFTYKNETINARSIMGILMLAAKKNCSIKMTITGDDANIVRDKLVEAFNTKFGEST